MKKIFNLYNITLVILLTLISVLTLRTTEVKATGTVTWPSGSTATISRTVQNVYNAPKVNFTYNVVEGSLKTADFAPGANVYNSMGILSGGPNHIYNVHSFLKATSLPEGFTPDPVNIVSSSTSEYPIYMWYSNNTIYYYSEADIIYLNPNSSYMFGDPDGNGSINLTNVSGLQYVNTSKVTNMECMFFAWRFTSDLDLTPLANWDVSNVTNMNSMFYAELSSNLTDISPLANWDTSNVTNMGTIFNNQQKISGTFPILGNPTMYGDAFYNAATQSGSQITVNYGSGTTNIDSIIATKSNNSNVVKGVQVSPPSTSPSGGITATATISFNGNETVSNSYTATKSTTINLANLGLTFTEPGNYEFKVNEIVTSNNAYPITSDTYTIVITVRNELNANNRPTGNLEATFVIKDSNDNKVNTMSFSAPKDESKFGHIELTKKVKGLMGSITKYFEFSVQIDDAASNACSSYSGNEKYPVSGVDSGHYSAAEVTKCKSGTKDSLSLKHNQTAIIGQFTYNNNTYDSISIDDYYKIIESAESDYTTTFKINSGSTTSGRDTGSKAITHSGKIVTFYNQREGSPLTGLILTILPYLILVGIGIGGVLLYKNRKELLKVKI
ncbi:MAG: BspA family leucine-rich repeat surface protein [Bacilli bacterium]|nr:BspA family leucine-rich repeat surface protein [Bacilli bacterium]